jgi:hypothetical protein
LGKVMAASSRTLSGQEMPATLPLPASGIIGKGRAAR